MSFLDHGLPCLFDQVLMVLIKLRLSLADQDIAYRLGLHQSTVSRNIPKWINIMYIRLQPLVKWPEREDLLMTMPMELEEISSAVPLLLTVLKYFVNIQPTSRLNCGLITNIITQSSISLALHHKES